MILAYQKNRKEYKVYVDFEHNAETKTTICYLCDFKTKKTLAIGVACASEADRFSREIVRKVAATKALHKARGKRSCCWHWVSLMRAPRLSLMISRE